MNRENLTNIFKKHIPQTEMDREEFFMMFNILKHKDENFFTDIEIMDKKSEVYEHFKPLIESFQGQIFLKRLKAFTKLKMTLGAFAILMQHMPTPGACVMYTYYLHIMLPEDTLITVETFAEVFSMGFFSEAQLNDIWNAQKVNSEKAKEFTCIGAPDNMIDYVEVWNND